MTNFLIPDETVDYYIVKYKDGSVDQKRTKFCNDNRDDLHNKYGIPRNGEKIEEYFNIKTCYKHANERVVYHFMNDEKRT